MKVENAKSYVSAFKRKADYSNSQSFSSPRSIHSEIPSYAAVAETDPLEQVKLRLQRERKIRAENARRRKQKRQNALNAKAKEEADRKEILEKRKKKLENITQKVRKHFREKNLSPRPPHNSSVNGSSKHDTNPKKSEIKHPGENFDWFVGSSNNPVGKANRLETHVGQSPAWNVVLSDEARSKLNTRSNAQRNRTIAATSSTVSYNAETPRSMFQETAEEMIAARGLISNIRQQLEKGDLDDLVLLNEQDVPHGKDSDYHYGQQLHNDAFDERGSVIDFEVKSVDQEVESETMDQECDSLEGDHNNPTWETNSVSKFQHSCKRHSNEKRCSPTNLQFIQYSETNCDTTHQYTHSNVQTDEQQQHSGTDSYSEYATTPMFIANNPTSTMGERQQQSRSGTEISDVENQLQISDKGYGLRYRLGGPHERSNSNQAAHDRSNSNQAFHDKSNSNQAAHDRNISNQAFHAKSNSNQAAHDRNNSNQATHDRSNSNQAAHDRNNSNQATHDRSNSNQAAHDESCSQQPSRESSEASHVDEEREREFFSTAIPPQRNLVSFPNRVRNRARQQTSNSTHNKPRWGGGQETEKQRARRVAFERRQQYTKRLSNKVKQGKNVRHDRQGLDVENVGLRANQVGTKTRKLFRVKDIAKDPTQVPDEVQALEAEECDLEASLQRLDAKLKSQSAKLVQKKQSQRSSLTHPQQPTLHQHGQQHQYEQQQQQQSPTHPQQPTLHHHEQQQQHQRQQQQQQPQPSSLTHPQQPTLHHHEQQQQHQRQQQQQQPQPSSLTHPQQPTLHHHEQQQQQEDARCETFKHCKVPEQQAPQLAYSRIDHSPNTTRTNGTWTSNQVTDSRQPLAAFNRNYSIPQAPDEWQRQNNQMRTNVQHQRVRLQPVHRSEYNATKIVNQGMSSNQFLQTNVHVPDISTTQSSWYGPEDNSKVWYQPNVHKHASSYQLSDITNDPLKPQAIRSTLYPNITSSASVAPSSTVTQPLPGFSTGTVSESGRLFGKGSVLPAIKFPPILSKGSVHQAPQSAREPMSRPKLDPFLGVKCGKQSSLRKPKVRSNTGLPSRKSARNRSSADTNTGIIRTTPAMRLLLDPC